MKFLEKTIIGLGIFLFLVNAAAAFTQDPAGVISREAWGADESYRYLSNNNIDPVLVDVDEEFYEKFKEELQYLRVVEADDNGDKYRWPLQYPEGIVKFIIHHTATTKNLDNPTQAIKDIYHSHAIGNSWGDIGYNYIVDLEGKIYEGRAGGEGIIGAHAGPGNHGSIGIAVLGNYDEEPVPQSVITALGRLIGIKSKIHSIIPDGYSEFRGEFSPNIIGHSDQMSTRCPGAYLYEKLPIIRAIAAAYEPREKEKFVKDYDFQDRSEIYYLELLPDELIDVEVKMENIGNVIWDENTFIVADEDPAFNGVVSFPGPDPIVLAEIGENSVAPGETATFNFQIKAGKKGETVYMHIAPVINGRKKTRDYVVIPVAVQQVDYRYEFAESNYPGEAMEKGETFEGWVKLKNVGNITWRKSGENTVVLGADHYRDRISGFVSPTSARISYLQEDEVAPGEIGTFPLSLKAPNQAGYYKEYFTPVVEGATWMSDTGMYFETTVIGDLYEAEVVKINAKSEWKRDKNYLIQIQLRNLGQETWTQENMEIKVLKETDLIVRDAKLLNESVAPGEAGIISFVTEVDENEELERKAVLVRPKVNGVYLIKRPIYVRYQVIENVIPVPYTAKLNENNNNIRVKLSFSGEPEITASGIYEIYSGTDFVTVLGADRTAQIKFANGNYQIITQIATFTKPNPIRFIPKGNSILRIANFTNRPSWNTDLNDNQYRGILEVQNVEGDGLTVINELPLEDYLKGLGEVPNNEEPEKIKAIMVAARSYAKFYMTKAEKFPGKPYHLDDNPNVSQKYLGYGFEQRAPNIASAAEATSGEVITYEGELVKTPYFSQSDGTQTKSAMEVWSWDAPYLVPVDDSYCSATEFRGHGVGLSGCGAREMASQGFSYTEILTHYYTAVEITDLY